MDLAKFAVSALHPRVPPLATGLVRN